MHLGTVHPPSIDTVHLSSSAIIHLPLSDTVHCNTVHCDTVHDCTVHLDNVHPNNVHPAKNNITCEKAEKFEELILEVDETGILRDEEGHPRNNVGQ